MTDTIQASTGKTEETLDERFKNWEREKAGIIRDLQSERQLRQQYEERLARLEQSLTSAGDEDGEKPDERVNRLAQDPDSYILNVVGPEIEKRDKKIASLEMKTLLDEAYDWLAEQENTTPRKLKGGKLDQELVRIVGEHNLGSLDPISGTQAAYKIYQQEKREKEAREAERAASIEANATETVRTAPKSSGTGFTVDEISRMSKEEFDRRYPEIKEAQAKGLIKR